MSDPVATAPALSAAAAPGEGSAPQDLDRLVRDIVLLEDVTRHWEEQPRHTVQALRRAIEDLYREAFTRLIRRLRKSPEAAAALREAATDEVIYAVLRRLEVVRPSLHERVEGALTSIRPMLAQHQGDVELVEVVLPDTVEIRLLGTCDGCPASGLTLREGVEKAIREACPEVRTIRLRKGQGGGNGKVDYVSPFARADDVGWLRASSLAAIPEGGVRAVEVQQRSVLLHRAGGRVSAFENQCAHLGMPLDDGAVEAGVLTCSHHGFRFLLETGECLTAPEVQLVTHAVRVVGDTVEVRLS
jgi:nitrite reductase/ring-hydroxylating ferredoxin subunit/Fe-S cluster biogenesis protein NfuA